MIKAIIFDFDGVICESVNVKTEAFAKMYKPHGEEVVNKVVAHHLNNSGISRFEKFKYYHKEFLGIEISENEGLELAQTFSNLVLNKVIESPYVKGAYEFISNYYGTYDMFISSGTPEDEMKEITTRRNLTQYFKEIYGSPQKKAYIVKKIIYTNNLDSREIIYVGDALSDYEAAKNKSNHFIARIHKDNNSIFANIDCLKINNLEELHLIIKTFFY